MVKQVLISCRKTENCCTTTEILIIRDQCKTLEYGGRGEGRFRFWEPPD